MIKVATIANVIGEASKKGAKVVIDNLPKINTVLTVTTAGLGLVEAIVNLRKQSNNKPAPSETKVDVVEIVDVDTPAPEE